MANNIKTIWTAEMDNFLANNYQKHTNPQLATKLGLTLTVTRNRLRELNIKRLEMEYWTGQQKEYLLNNYKIKGNVEIAKHFNSCYPKNKLWTKRHINKKMGYLNIIRTRAEINAIVADNNAIRLNNALLKKQQPKVFIEKLMLDNKTIIYLKSGSNPLDVAHKYNTRNTNF